MNKELEALECLENLRCNLYNKSYLEKNALDDCTVIQQALQRLEQIDNAKRWKK